MNRIFTYKIKTYFCKEYDKTGTSKHNNNSRDNIKNLLWFKQIIVQFESWKEERGYCIQASKGYID